MIYAKLIEFKKKYTYIHLSDGIWRVAKERVRMWKDSYGISYIIDGCKQIKSRKVTK